MDQDKSRRIVVAVTGGIAAYKAAELTSLLIKTGAEVRVAMTAAAEEFIAPLTFEALTQHPVYRYVTGDTRSFEMEHITWARWADTLLIAPATANCIAKMANGISDDAVTTLYLAFTNTVMVAPSMNTTMLEHAATQDNLAVLERRGAKILKSGTGSLACGESGPGRMAEPEEIVAALGLGMTPGRPAMAGPGGPIIPVSNELRGANVLVTLGPTHEYLDPVRFLGNPSTGAMGAALSREAARRGANVISVCGPVPRENLPDDAGEVHRIVSAEEMLQKTADFLEWADVMIFVAAVGDFKVAQIVDHKIKRTGNSISLPLVENPDIAQAMSFRKKPGQLMVGFAAETDDIEENARQKLARKNLDAIIANPVGTSEGGFASDTNSGFLLTANGERIELTAGSKPVFAADIWDNLIRILQSDDTIDIDR